MSFFKLSELKKLKKNGVVFEDIKSVKISDDCIIDHGTFVGKNVTIENNSQLHFGAKILQNSNIRNSIIGENTVVNISEITDSEVGKNCIIGPFSHIKMGSSLGDNIRVGNFVEIKSSKIGNSTKAAHLAYIGNATIGNNVNIGCGVVFANYDGKKKHHTTVGDGVFIGCNCNLIAPITIGDNVFIAAGTTVTKDVPEGNFCIGRSKATTKERVIKD